MTLTGFIKTVGFTAAAVCALFIAEQPAWATDDGTPTEVCEDRWEDGNLTDYCPNATVTGGYKPGGSFWNPPPLTCSVSVTCSVDVTVDGEEQTFSKAFSETGPQLGSLTLCFRKVVQGNGDRAWDMIMAGSCGSSIDVTTAVDDGLGAP